MVILHLWAGRQYGLSSGHFSQTVRGSQPSLRMPTNGLLRVAGIESRCGARSERSLHEPTR